MSFYGYDNEEQLRTFNFMDADRIIQNAKACKINVCSRDKQCIGSIDGITYLYADGSQDKGIEKTHYRSEYNGNVFAWGE